MKAEINEKGTLLIFAENETESYAMDQWELNNRDGCSTQFKSKNTYDALILMAYKRKQITLFKRIWLQILLFLCK
jgi:hypothetical protein